MKMRGSLTMLAAAAALLLACGSSSSGSADGSYAEAFCAKVAPCCTAAKLPSSAVTCESFLGTTATASSACLDALAAEPQDTFCQDLGASLTACVAGVTAGGAVAPGGSCSADIDCATSSQGIVYCAEGEGANGTSLCVVQQRGTVGSKPCVSTVEGGGIELFTPGGTPAAESYSCDTSDGVYCDGASFTCIATKGAGGACTQEYECDGVDGCDMTSDTCVPLAALGAACTTDVGCSAGAYCNGSTCVATLADGVACSTDGDCTSKFCTGAVCVSAVQANVALLCTGTAS